jgi:prepilin-type N-terminal cleavage/methylation domain-containing protein
MLGMSMNVCVQKNQQSCGFSLVEISVVLVILATLTGMIAVLAGKQSSTSKYEDTKAMLKIIDEALQRELLFTGVLPCPARRTALPTAANFGQATNCTGAAPAGTDDVSTIGGAVTADDIRIGALPTRTLNLPDKMAVDAWNMRFTYAVVRNLGNNNTQATFDGYTPPAATANRIIINDANGNPMLKSLASTPADSFVAYVIISHGADKKGATSANGSTTNACTAGFLDTENCNSDGTFIQADIADDTTRPAAFYDDLMIWKPYHLIAPALK